MTVSINNKFSQDDLHGRMTESFVALYSRFSTWFGGGGRGYYGVRIENLALDGSELDLIMTFRSGEQYCCGQPICDFAFDEASTWESLRVDMDANGLSAFPVPTIRKLRGVVEAGAVFVLNGRLINGPLVSEGYEYEDGPYPPVMKPVEG